MCKGLSWLHWRDGKSKFGTIIGLISLLALVLVIHFVLAEPTEPKNIAGRVFHNNGSGAENGIPVIIINNYLGEETRTKVYAPPIPALAGSYSTTINGATGNSITVRAFNKTYFGETDSTLTDSTTYVNVTMNLSRYSELNTTIISPSGNTIFAGYEAFNVTVNVSVLGNDATGCNVTINISNESIANITQGETTSHSLGNLNLGENAQTNFELIGNSAGSVNITAIGACDSDGIILENLETSTIYNITIQDESPPHVETIRPENNTLNKSTQNITFVFNISDLSRINNCTLILNNSANKSISNPDKNIEEEITEILENKDYEWRIACTDEWGYTGYSEINNLSVRAFHPVVESIVMPNSVMLNSGSTKKVECNFSVRDDNGASDIKEVNATFFHETSTSHAENNNNTHYSNSSCEKLAEHPNYNEYRCSFYVHYYALNGSWTCNASAEDYQGLEGHNNTLTDVEPLFALNVSEDVVDYGEVEPDTTSDEKTITIRNIGNQPINVFLKGYGGNNPVAGEGYAMSCDNNQNISIENERYGLSSGSYLTKTNLSSSLADSGLDITKQTLPLSYEEELLYWQIYVPPMGRANCSGTIMVSATGS